MSKTRRPRRPRYPNPPFPPALIARESVPAPDEAEASPTGSTAQIDLPAHLDTASESQTAPSPVAFEADVASGATEGTSFEPVSGGELVPEPVTIAAPALALPPIAPVQLGAESFGTTVMNYFIGEGEAFAAHLRALAGARSMADFVRLQIGEFQRAADATLTCWGVLTVSATRTVAAR